MSDMCLKAVSGNQKIILRIVAQLIDAQTDTHIWAEKYAGKLDEYLLIFKKMCHNQLLMPLKLKLSSEEKKKIDEQSHRKHSCL